MPSNKIGSNGHKVKHKSLFEPHFFTVSLSPGTGCPESLWSLHPWRYSKDIWMQSLTGFSTRPCLNIGVGPTICRGSSQPHSFCGSMTMHVAVLVLTPSTISGSDYNWKKKKVRISCFFSYSIIKYILLMFGFLLLILCIIKAQIIFHIWNYLNDVHFLIVK